jgi:CRISPR-associated protein Cas1
MTGPGQRGASAPYQLPRIADRVSFVYLERCTVHRDANAITAQDADGITHIPSATIGTLLPGPGTRITHQAMAVLGDCGANVAWVGEHGARFYAAARSLNRSSALVEAQATLWANRRTRLEVARAMYRMRFPDEDPSGFMRQQLLGMEGRRLKECYRQQSQRTGVPWQGRQYTPGNFSAGDSINQAIAAAAQCMYGIAHTAITALGCSPGLGFIHPDTSCHSSWTSRTFTRPKSPSPSPSTQQPRTRRTSEHEPAVRCGTESVPLGSLNAASMTSKPC